MIEFKHVTKVFHGTTIIDDISFVIPDGEFVVLLGESGCGKTTTLKMINKLIAPSSGTVEIGGRDIAGMDTIALRRRMGYVIQQIGLFPHMTIKENIEIIAKMNSKDKDRMEENARKLMGMVNLDPDQYLDSYPSELSGGQQQRAGVVRAFMTEPEIVLMDEPFSALRSDHQVSDTKCTDRYAGCTEAYYCLCDSRHGGSNPSGRPYLYHGRRENHTV